MSTIEVLHHRRPTNQSIRGLRDAEGRPWHTAPPALTPAHAQASTALIARSTGRLRPWAARVAAGVVLVLLVVRWWQWMQLASRFQDLAVYRAGAQAIAGGASPYAARPAGGHELVFTYPPFAAVIFEPLARLPWSVAAGSLLVASLSAYLVVVAVTGNVLGWTTRAVAAAAAVGLLAEPVLRTVQQGQINLILAVMVTVDALVAPRLFRGALVGLAAGVKVVPGAFVLLFLARGDRRAALTAAAAGAVTLGMSWLVAPAPTVAYWTSLLFDTTRSGGGGYPDNQSIVGVLARALHDDTPPSWATLPLQVGVLLLAYHRARTASRAGDDLTPLLAIAIGALLASPVSWSHHWVWSVPLLMVLVHQQRWAAAVVGAAAVTLAPLALSPLGALAGTPTWLWQPTAAMAPALGLAWLVLGRTGARGGPAGCVRRTITGASPWPAQRSVRSWGLTRTCGWWVPLRARVTARPPPRPPRGRSSAHPRPT